MRRISDLFGRAMIAGVAACLLLPSGAAALEKVRIGLLKFGTVNWEVDTIRHNKLDTANGIELEVVELASNDATRVAIQARDVDVIVSDWLFVARQRSEGEKLTFVPYSTSVGAVMVHADSGVQSLEDLKGKKIGVAGGPLDKGWLMLRGMAQGTYGFDLAAETEQVFGAPPLLAETLQQGDLDAALNYWNYNAKLEAAGFRPLVSAQQAARALGATGDLSAIGYVFSEDWAAQHRDAALGFVKASRAAKALLAKSDEEWQRLRPLMNAEDDAVFAVLVKRYREGIPNRPIAEEIRDTALVYEHLAKIGGEKLVGKASRMPEGTFWSGLSDGS
jgi:NitT/TauT family transport system substrate-binding protein